MIREAQTETALEDLVAYNDSYYSVYKKRPFFQMIRDGVLNNNDVKRKIFFNYMQIFAENFQFMMHARQASCRDERFSPVFLQHLHEEIGHDNLLKQRDDYEELFDPILAGVGVWFVHQMSVLDNVEKTAVMHLVVEMAGDYYHSVADERLSRYLKSDYYAIHAEHDEDHCQMGLELMRGYPPFVHKRLKKLIRESWSMMYTMLDRVHALVMRSADEQ